jgi:hypothetical protein
VVAAYPCLYAHAVVVSHERPVHVGEYIVDRAGHNILTCLASERFEEDSGPSERERCTLRHSLSLRADCVARSPPLPESAMSKEPSSATVPTNGTRESRATTTSSVPAAAAPAAPRAWVTPPPRTTAETTCVDPSRSVFRLGSASYVLSVLK